MTWEEFQRSDPELAALGRERFDRTGLILLGTLRKNGWPRISPVEVLITDGQLYLGMMWRSRKALDLLRDPRCTVHSTVSDRAGTEGEFKVYGHAVDVQDVEARRRYGDALYEKIQVRPDESEYHLFAVDIQSAAFVIIRNEEMVHQEWKAC
ncbi:MAG: pyridoxamine 5'-phosphate oxidase family protein [Chloroflexi bacterium]|nr:pyridoxamine 5'-phosphate oxidase family protein [Chloroflexota bacterium]